MSSRTSSPPSVASSGSLPSRTLAVLKPHAVKHRLTIEPRILQAGFEIVKERQLQFHPDDPLVHDLFGYEATSLKGSVLLFLIAFFPLFD